MSPCEGCTCGGGPCENGGRPKPRPGSLPWLALVLLVLLGAAGQSAGELQNLSVSALIARVMQSGTDNQKQALQQLAQSFRK